MKNILNYILGCILATVAISACEDSSKYPIPNVTQGAIPLFTQNADDSGFINYLDPDKTNISFQLDKDGTEKVSGIDVVIVYNNSVNGKKDTVIYTTVSDLPGKVVINKSQLLGAFPKEVLTQDTLTIGDSFTITGNVKLADGRYLSGGFSPSVFGKKPISIVYNVTCLSAIHLGAYSAVSTGTSTDPCPPSKTLTNFSSDVVLSSSSAGVYTVSDFFAGLYVAWYGACYGAKINPGQFTDICNDLSISFIGGFGEKVTGTGSYDPGTGKITYSWTNEFGDTGATVLTPK